MGKVRQFIVDMVTPLFSESGYLPLSLARFTRKGVPRFVTYRRWTVPPRWACWAALGVNVLTALIGVTFITLGAEYNGPVGVWAGIALLVYALMILVGDLRLLRLRDRIAETRPEHDVRIQLGLSERAFRKLASENKIEPHYIVNDTKMYHPEEFRGALTLLRPAGASDEELLVRPAESANQPEALLVRPAESSQE